MICKNCGVGIEQFNGVWYHSTSFLNAEAKAMFCINASSTFVEPAGQNTKATPIDICVHCGLEIEPSTSYIFTDGTPVYIHKKTKTHRWHICDYALEDLGKSVIGGQYTAKPSIDYGKGKEEIDYNKYKLQKTKAIETNDKITQEPHICKHCGKSDNDPVMNVMVLVEPHGRKFKYGL